jgi:hypothetical protein
MYYVGFRTGHTHVREHAQVSEEDHIAGWPECAEVVRPGSRRFQNEHFFENAG